MKIRLAKGSQLPPDEPVLVVLDGQVCTPDVDYTLKSGGLPEFKSGVLPKNKTHKPGVLMLIPRMTRLVYDHGPGNPASGVQINPPVSYEIRWEDDEMTGIVATDNKP